MHIYVQYRHMLKCVLTEGIYKYIHIYKYAYTHADMQTYIQTLIIRYSTASTIVSR